MLTMERRQLLKQSVFALAAFSFSRNSYATEEAALLAHHPLNNATDIIRLGQNENPHGPSSMTKKQCWKLFPAPTGTNWI